MDDLLEKAGKLRILSDLHLGHPGSKISSVASLKPLIAGAETIVFNGDTVEQTARLVGPRAEELFGELQQLCDRHGARPIFLTGNHDPHISEHHHLDLCGGQVLVAHGDLLYDTICPWSREVVRGGARRAALREVHIGEPAGDLAERIRRTNLCRTLMRELPLRPRRWPVLGRIANLVEEIWPPRRILAILRLWEGAHRDAIAVLRTYRPEARFIIFGHTHFPGVYSAGGRTAINTGSYRTFPGARMVEIDGDTLSVHHVRKEGEVYRASSASHRFRTAADRWDESLRR